MLFFVLFFALLGFINAEDFQKCSKKNVGVDFVYLFNKDSQGPYHDTTLSLLNSTVPSIIKHLFNEYPLSRAGIATYGAVQGRKDCYNLERSLTNSTTRLHNVLFRLSQRLTKLGETPELSLMAAGLAASDPHMRWRKSNRIKIILLTTDDGIIMPKDKHSDCFSRDKHKSCSSCVPTPKEIGELLKAEGVYLLTAVDYQTPSDTSLTQWEGYGRDMTNQGKQIYIQDVGINVLGSTITSLINSIFCDHGNKERSSRYTYSTNAIKIDKAHHGEEQSRQQNNNAQARSQGSNYYGNRATFKTQRPEQHAEHRSQDDASLLGAPVANKSEFPGRLKRYSSFQSPQARINEIQQIEGHHQQAVDQTASFSQKSTIRMKKTQKCKQFRKKAQPKLDTTERTVSNSNNNQKAMQKHTTVICGASGDRTYQSGGKITGHDLSYIGNRANADSSVHFVSGATNLDLTSLSGSTSQRQEKHGVQSQSTSLNQADGLAAQKKYHGHIGFRIVTNPEVEKPDKQKSGNSLPTASGEHRTGNGVEFSQDKFKTLVDTIGKTRASTVTPNQRIIIEDHIPEELLAKIRQRETTLKGAQSASTSTSTLRKGIEKPLTNKNSLSTAVKNGKAEGTWEEQNSESSIVQQTKSEKPAQSFPVKQNDNLGSKRITTTEQTSSTFTEVLPPRQGVQEEKNDQSQTKQSDNDLLTQKIHKDKTQTDHSTNQVEILTPQDTEGDQAEVDSTSYDELSTVPQFGEDDIDADMSGEEEDSISQNSRDDETKTVVTHGNKVSSSQVQTVVTHQSEGSSSLYSHGEVVHQAVPKPGKNVLTNRNNGGEVTEETLHNRRSGLSSHEEFEREEEKIKLTNRNSDSSTDQEDHNEDADIKSEKSAPINNQPTQVPPTLKKTEKSQNNTPKVLADAETPKVSADAETPKVSADVETEHTTVTTQTGHSKFSSQTDVKNGGQLSSDTDRNNIDETKSDAKSVLTPNIPSKNTPPNDNLPGNVPRKNIFDGNTPPLSKPSEDVLTNRNNGGEVIEEALQNRRSGLSTHEKSEREGKKPTLTNRNSDLSAGQEDPSENRDNTLPQIAPIDDQATQVPPTSGNTKRPLSSTTGVSSNAETKQFAVVTETTSHNDHSSRMNKGGLEQLPPEVNHGSLRNGKQSRAGQRDKDNKSNNAGNKGISEPTSNRETTMTASALPNSIPSQSNVPASGLNGSGSTTVTETVTPSVNPQERSSTSGKDRLIGDNRNNDSTQEKVGTSTNPINVPSKSDNVITNESTDATHPSRVGNQIPAEKTAGLNDGNPLTETPKPTPTVAPEAKKTSDTNKEEPTTTTTQKPKKTSPAVISTAVGGSVLGVGTAAAVASKMGLFQSTPDILTQAFEDGFETPLAEEALERDVVAQVSFD